MTTPSPLDAVEINLQPHYEIRNKKPVWITYKDGQEVVDVYSHQDENYSNMCSFNYCRCSQ